MRLTGWAIVCATCVSTTFAADWPQWRGPERTNLSKETGLLATWPKDGPSLTWTAEKLGHGHSTPSIAKGRVYGLSIRGNDEVVWALDEKTGRELWATPIGRKGGREPGCSPTVDGEQLYVLGIAGDLACVSVADGKVTWSKNVKKDFGGEVGGWHYNESILIDGNKLLCAPGGGKATIVALDKKSGETLWTTPVPGTQAHYASFIIAEIAGVKQYVQFLESGVMGFAADKGTLLWSYEAPANSTANCSTPIYSDGHVFAASAYGTGGGLVKVSRDGDKWKADEVYFTKKMKNHHGGMVLVDGHLYGENDGVLVCLEFKTGKVMWESRRPGKGAITFADGRLYFRNEGGPVYLIEANPMKYVEHGRFEQPKRSGHPAWAHPVVANGKLYIRDSDRMYCYDVKAPK